jgi:hypothetical protein
MTSGIAEWCPFSARKEGQADRFVLFMMGGETSLEEIARRTLEETLGRFAGWTEALTGAGELSAKRSRSPHSHHGTTPRRLPFRPSPCDYIPKLAAVRAERDKAAAIAAEVRAKGERPLAAAARRDEEPSRIENQDLVCSPSGPRGYWGG